MTLILCSTNDVILKRWTTILNSRYDLLRATSIEALQSLCAEKKSQMLLIHQPVLEPGEINKIISSDQSCKVILCSDQPSEDEGVQFLRSGVVGYLNTYSAPARLLEAIRVIDEGRVWVGHKLMQRLIHNTSATGTKKNSQEICQHYSLTQRELEIAQLVAAGNSNLEIAAQLNISERTVKAHLNSTFKKTVTDGRLQLALLFRE